jgi:hypothetical protein
MANSRLHNALLFVIALCLVLIVVHLYSGHVVAKAQAQTSDHQDVHLYGEYCQNGVCGWQPVGVDGNGNLFTTK